MLKIENKRELFFEKRKHLINSILSGESELYIFGITKYGEIIYNQLKSKSISIKGFVDDITNDKTFLNESVFKTSDLPKESIIILAIVEGRPKTLRNYLSKNGYENIVDYFDFNFIDPKKFPIPFNCGNYDKIISNIKKYENVFEKLEDEVSKKIFLSIIDFRINFNYLEHNFTYCIKDQYFENFLNFNIIKTFIDAGGYDGSTTKNAINRFKNLKKVFYIEPFPKSMSDSKKNLSSIKGVQLVFLETALSKFNGFRLITDSEGSANHLSEGGEIRVKVSSLDSIINEKIDYFKLDIEGEELNALKGSESLIKTFKPFIAACIYHDQNHFWQIPEYLLSLNPGYKVYVRHYTEGIYETVMYFI